MPEREDDGEVVEYMWENHHPIHCEETTVLDYQELLVKRPCTP